MKRLSILLISLPVLLLASSYGWGQVTGKSLILQDSSAPARTITLRSPGTLLNSYSLIYPSALPAGNGYLLTATTAGLLRWSAPDSVIGSLAWLLNGNSSIVVPTSDTIAPGENFLGTRGAQELVLGTNGVRRVRVDGTTGHVGIGTAPSVNERLNVHGPINTDSVYRIDGANWLWAGPPLGGANNVLVGNTTNTTLAADDNTFIGSRAGANATTGIDNTFIGANAGAATTTGSDNTYIGPFTGQLNVGGSANTVVGSSATNVMTSGDHNTVMGFASGNSLITGSHNTIIGSSAAGSLNNANRVTLLGASAATNAQTNVTTIGANAYATADNSMVLGSINGVNGATADVNVGIGTTAPAHRLNVVTSFAPSSAIDHIAARILTTMAPSALYTAQTNTIEGQLTINNSAQIDTNAIVNGIDGGAVHEATATAAVGKVSGIRGWVSSGNSAHAIEEGVGVLGYVTNSGRYINATALKGYGDGFAGTSITNFRGLHISGYRGPVTNVIGIDVDEIAAGTGSNTAFRYNHSTRPVIVDGTGRMMVGTTMSAAERLTVMDTIAPSVVADKFATHSRLFFAPTVPWVGTQSANGLRADIILQNTQGVNSERVAGIIAAGSLDASATSPVTQLRGLRANLLQRNSTQAVGHGIAAEGIIESQGPITNATSFLARMSNGGASTIGTYRGLYVTTPLGGPIDTAIGVDISPMTGATANYAFRYDNAAFPVVIAGSGSVGIGIRAPSERLEVRNGNMLLSNNGGTAGELRMQEPSAGGTEYTAFKAQAQSANITYTLPPSLPVANNYVLASTTGGSLTWENPATLNSGNFVQYNVPTPQSTAAASNRLFDVRYGGLAAGADAIGARIVSASGTNANATGLTLTSTANGTGTSTGLVVQATGGTANYAALFNSGNVGINVATPSSRLTIAEGIGTANRDTAMVAMFHNFSPTANPAPNVSVNSQVIRLTMNNTAAQTSGLISAADFGAALGPSATASAANLTGLRGFANNANTTQTLTQAVGVSGHIQNNGPMTNGISFLANSQVLAGTMTNYFGLKVQGPGMSGGTIQNAYGIRIDTMTAGTVSNTAFHYNHPTFPTVITGPGKMGVGTTTPLANHEIVGPTYSATTTQPGDWTPFLASKTSQTVNPSGAVGANFHSLMAYDSLAITGNSNMGTGVAIGRFSRVRNFNTSSLGEIRSMQMNVHNESTGTVTIANAIYADVSNNSTGTITQANSFSSLLENVGSGTVALASGLKTRPHVWGAGNITTYNGLWVDVASHNSTGRVINYNGVAISNIDPGEVTGTRNAFIYNGAGANDPVAITGAGQVGIGITTPTVSLDVDGGLVLREDASINNVNADNFAVTVGNRSYLRIGCNQAGAATTKTITLSAGLRVGQMLVIEATGTNSFEIADNAAVNNTNVPASRTMSAGTVATLIWNGTSWLEVAFAAN